MRSIIARAPTGKGEFVVVGILANCLDQHLDDIARRETKGVFHLGGISCLLCTGGGERPAFKYGVILVVRSDCPLSGKLANRVVHAHPGYGVSRCGRPRTKGQHSGAEFVRLIWGSTGISVAGAPSFSASAMF